MVNSQALALLASASSVAAFPQLMELDSALSGKLANLEKRAVEPPYRAPVVPINRPNTGLPPLGFDAADQFVDVSDSGPHPFKAPGPGDKRGQCPGLNAASNHGFFPRNGLPTIQDSKQFLISICFDLHGEKNEVKSSSTLHFAFSMKSENWKR